MVTNGETPSGAEGDPIHVETTSTRTPQEMAAEVARAVAVVEAKELVSRQFRVALAGYVIMAIGIVVGLYAMQVRSDSHLKSQLNALGKSGCETGRVNTAKYNDFVQSAIDNRMDLKRLALQRGDKAGAAIQDKAIARFKGNFIRVATKAECARPIIP